VTLGEDIRLVKQQAGAVLSFYRAALSIRSAQLGVFEVIGANFPAYLILGLVLVAASAPHQLLLLLSCPIIGRRKTLPLPDDYRGAQSRSPANGIHSLRLFDFHTSS